LAFVLIVRLVADSRFWERSLPVKIVGSAALVMLAALYIGTPLKKWNSVQSIDSLAGCRSSDSRAGCVPLDPAEMQAVRFVQNAVPPGERIYSGSSRHDRVFGNDLLFYFLSARHSATKFHEVEPRVTNTLPVQRQIVEDLKHNRVRYLVLFAGFDHMQEPNASMENSGVTYLDDFIRSHYRPVERFGNYAIWRMAE
jgi:hypothetical protein